MASFGLARAGNSELEFRPEMIIDQHRSDFEEPNSFVGRERELDEVRLYARALSADQIEQLYRSFAQTR